MGQRTMSRRSLGLVLAFAVTLAFGGPAGAVAPPPFGILFNATGWQAGANPVTVVVGDSLVNGVNPQALASLMKNATGRSTWVAASAGASTFNFIAPGWLDDPPWGGPDLANIESYNVFFNARATVIALGSNDARIMTTNPSSYNINAYNSVLNEALRQARTRSRCVLLINVANHWDDIGGSIRANIDAVNFVMGSKGDSRTFVIDWAGRSRGQAWFAGPGDIHHNDVGKLMYADLINKSLQFVVAAGLCN